MVDHAATLFGFPCSFGALTEWYENYTEVICLLFEVEERRRVLLKLFVVFGVMFLLNKCFVLLMLKKKLCGNFLIHVFLTLMMVGHEDAPNGADFELV